MMKAEWYYMRENHTFRKLLGTKKEMCMDLMEDFLDGHTYGMLCTKTKGYDHIQVHAHGSKRWKEFIEECMKVIE